MQLERQAGAHGNQSPAYSIMTHRLARQRPLLIDRGPLLWRHFFSSEEGGGELTAEKGWIINARRRHIHNKKKKEENVAVAAASLLVTYWGFPALRTQRDNTGRKGGTWRRGENMDGCRGLDIHARDRHTLSESTMCVTLPLRRGPGNDKGRGSDGKISRRLYAYHMSHPSIPGFPVKYTTGEGSRVWEECREDPVTPLVSRWSGVRWSS